ncbi:MAG: hypothetical protein EAZ92_09355 [Candidatus Kapaibacterium sp.]|nr:MAG: hypothetical protein EAZ92_09355 [Candidatus Kapabacteria bacterium]
MVCIVNRGNSLYKLLKNEEKFSMLISMLKKFYDCDLLVKRTDKIKNRLLPHFLLSLLSSSLRKEERLKYIEQIYLQSNQDSLLVKRKYNGTKPLVQEV